tara:strand:+ start:7585 stop:8637 length:1053 start_codon:yes stop_codon:yes gene_type:complete
MKAKIRYKHSPQLKIYDQLMNNWEPYTMFKHPRNYKSKTLNTDDFGCRYTEDKNSKYSLFNKNDSKQSIEVAIFGGSTAFGVGSSQDSKTISSVISAHSNFQVYNMGFRAYNSFQELTLFNQIYNKFENLKHLVFVSGFNDIFLSEYIEIKNNLETSPFYFQSEFENKMNFPHNSFYKKLLFYILPKNLRSKINWALDDKNSIFKKIFNNKKKDYKVVKYNWKKNYEKNLKIWNILSKNLGFKILFVLQPFFPWTDKDPSIEEQEIFEELKKNNSQKVIRSLLSIKKESYDEAAFFFKEICEKNKISFLDMNKQISQNKFSNKWFFVDSLHLNDYGYDFVAKNILNYLND